MLATIENLRLRALALRSSVHNEHCLTAIELAGMTAKKTNELIDVLNELITTLENGVNAVYDPETESLEIKLEV